MIAVAMSHAMVDPETALIVGAIIGFIAGALAVHFAEHPLSDKPPA